MNFQSFDYGEGDLSLVGDASILQDDSISLPGNVKRLRLTPGQASKEGTAWLSQKMDLGYGFTTEFSMHMLADGDTGGEGLSFILQNNDTGVGVSCGAPGPGAKDLTLAFLDDGGPVLKVRSAGEDLKVVDLAAVDGLTGLALTSTDKGSAPHVVRVKWTTGLLSVWLNGVQVLGNHEMDLLAGGAMDSDGRAFVGFAANTGEVSQSQDITRWVFVPGILELDYHHFDGREGDFVFVGDARVRNEFPNTSYPGDFSFLTITDNAKSKYGSAWLKEKVDLRAGFSTEFDLHFNHKVGASGADGMCFVIHNDAAGTSLNPGEWGINANGLTFALASYNRALLRIRGNGQNLLDVDLSQKPTVGGTFSKSLGDALPYRFKINYAPGDLDVFFDEEQVVDSLDVDLEALAASDADGNSWLGFSGRTGGQAENHEVTRWFLSTQKEFGDDTATIVLKDGDLYIPVSPDGQWEDPGYQVSRASGKILPASGVVLAGDSVDLSSPGFYRITYNYTFDNLTAEEVVRQVFVSETLEPGIPVSGTALHYDAADVNNDGFKDVFPDGHIINTWSDKSGHGRDISADGAPVFHPEMQNNLPFVSIAKTDRFLSGELAAQDVAGQDMNQTSVFAVLRFKGGDAGRVWMQWLGSGNTRIGIESNAVFDWGNLSAPSRSRLDNWAVGMENIRLVSVVKSPSAMSVFVDGGLVAQQGNPDTLVSSSSRFSLGGQPNSVNHLSELDVCEVILYNRALPPGDLNKVGYHLQQKWGIAGSYISAETDPKLKFEIGDLVYSPSMKFDLGAFSQSEPPSQGTITYTLTNGPATLSGAELSLNGIGAVTVTATIAADGDYVEQARSVTFNISPASFAFENGFSGSEGDFNLVSAAAFTEDVNIAEPGGVTRLRLTDNTTSKMGSAWYKNKMLAGEGFVTEFDAQFTYSLHSGADGMCFSLHNHASGPYLNVGERGPDDKSFSILIDSYQNGGAWADPSAACLHIKVNNTVIKTVSLPDFPAITAVTNNDLSNAGDAPPYRLRLEYIPGDLDLFFNDVQVVVDLDIKLGPDNALDGNGYTWLGFGGRTGGHAENHDITRWTFESHKVTILAGGPVISEFQAAPGGALTDEDGDTPPWIEIHNAGAQPVNLGGWSLTNDKANLALWSLPSIVMEPDTFLIVFLSGKNRGDPTGNLHSGFVIGDDAGISLTLVKPDGQTIASEYTMPKSHPGTSYGTLGMEQVFGYFQTPTPGSLNLPPQGLDPLLTFTLDKSYLDIGETLEIVAVSQSEPSSEGAVTYKLIAGPATLEGTTLTTTGKGAIELRASIDAAGDYASGMVNQTILVSEPAPSVPNGIPSGAVLHYDAWDKDNDGLIDVASDGANVYQWMDKSGNERHATAPGRPPWVHSAGINGHPSVYFQPIDLSRLESPELTTAEIAGPKGDAMTLFMVARYHSGIVWTQWQNGTQRYSIEFNGRFDFPNAIASQGQLTGWSTGVAGTPRIIVAMKTPTEQRIYLDGLLATSRPNATSLSPGGSSSISLGGQPGTTVNPATIDFGEYLLFNRALADGEANLVGFYLQEKWGFTEGLYIDPATDPQLVFQVNGQVYKDGMELPVTAFSMANPPSAGIISYSLDSGPGTLADEKLTVTEPGEFTITATLPANGDYVEQSRSVTFQIYPAEFTYNGFEEAQADFTLIGTAEITQDPDLAQPPDAWRLRITDNQNSKLGSAWYKYKMPMEDGFETEFNVHLAEAVNTGADGMTFILHNHPEGNKLNTSERGPDTDAITLQMDSYRNGGAWADPSAAFLRLTLDGETLALANLPDFPEITTIINNDLSQSGTDVAPYKVRIVYEPGDFDVYFEDVLVMDSIDLTLNSSNALDSRGLGWFGFSGRTGGAAENHDVTYWSFKNKTRRVLLGGPVISEFMANNKDGLRDEDGASTDWVEIHNASAGAVNLEGWHLSDDPVNLALWTFPRVLLEPNQYLVVHASAKDRKSDINRLHTNFQLGNAALGYLAFTKPDGISIVSEFKDYIEQKQDISYGTLGESQTVNYFTKPTPGNPNTGPQGIPSGKVLFSIAGGLFTDSFQVGLTAVFPEGAAIRYTLDGSIPTESSILYEAPIDIASTTQIRARTFSEGCLPGPIEKDTWIQVGNDLKGFSSNLPVIVLDSLGFDVDGDGARSRRQGYSVVIDVASETGRSTLLGTPDYAGNMGFNVRGQTSGSFPKKSYRMEVINDLGEDKSVSLLGMPKDDDWVLHSPYSDKTLMRNYLTHTWFEQMGRYAVRRKIVEVFVNQDGDAVTMSDYRGVSLLLEYIKRDGDRVDIAKLGPDELTAPDIEGGYLFKKDKGLDANTTFRTATENQELGFVYPGQPAGAQINYLKGYLDAFEQALHGANFADPVDGYAKYIDPGSFIDVHILVEMLKQIDGYRLSSYFHKDRGGKVVSGPVWDYNLSLGNADYNGGDNPEGWYHELVGGGNYPWYQRLFQDPEFTLAYWDRWHELRRDKFANEKLLALIETTTVLMEESQARNFDKWQVLGTKLWPNPSGWDTRDTHRKEVDWMKDWLQQRITWMDAQSSTPPVLNQQGGQVADGFQPSITPIDGGQVYFTTDGSDPRQRGGTVAPTAKAHPDVSVALPGAVATVRARSLNNGVWSALNEAIFIIEGAIATSDNLELTEIHYHPSIATEAESASGYTSSDFEFLEIHNSSDQSIEIKGVTIEQGKPFDQLTLDPGLLIADAYGVLVRNRAAFQVRYPDVPAESILGEWGSGRLSNGGETIWVTGADGQTILEVSFQDGDSVDPLNLWPTEPDGQGPSLVPSGAGADPNDPAWWKASSKVGGSPCEPDTVLTDPFADWKSTHFNAEQLADSSISGDDADPDGDQLSNQSEYIAGTDPLDANSTFQAKQAQLTGGEFIIILETVPGKIYKVQQSQRLATWTDVAGTTFTAANNEETIRLTPAFDDRGFYRVLVE